MAYSSTNKYGPVKKSTASGSTAKKPTEFVYFFYAAATMLTMTAPVNAMDSQRWSPNPFVPVHLGPRLKTIARRIGHTYKYYMTAFGEGVVLA